jgi:predicted permease
MRLLLGRDFTDRDTETAPRVVIINEAIARYFFGHQNPVGKRISFQFTGTPGELEIVGVVSNAKHITPRDQNRMMFYIPYRQDLGHLLQMCLAVRTVGNPLSVAARVRQELREIDPKLPVLKLDTIEQQLDDLLMVERLITTLTSSLGVLGVLLACLGLYGVISYTVARRTNEIGVRLALGATPGSVLRLVLRQSLALVLAGVVIGIPLALAAVRLVSAKLYGVSASDPLTIAAATLLIILVALLASFLPARQAAQVDPLVALRCE